MELRKFVLDFDENSSEPKYKQIAKSIVENIEAGRIHVGDQLPSISQLSIDYLVSRDTVEKAYRLLRDQGVVESVKGKGFYVLISSPGSKIRVFVLFNKLSSYKKVVYNSLAYELRNHAKLELFVYHCNLELFESYITDKLGRYNYYVIMPHFIDSEIGPAEKNRITTVLNKINPEKLIFLDNIVDNVVKYKGAVYQDFKSDVFNALSEASEQLRKYKKLVIVFPQNVPYPYPKKILEGFRKFCGFNNFEFEEVTEIKANTPVSKGTAYLIIEESDLSKLIKNVRNQNLKIGLDVGILTYNDTPLKEVLLEGISVISTEFSQLGVLASKIILNELSGAVKNEFKLVLRNSL
ncbi:GntR family transcriptional regulator [Marinoscillum furvescens]|uniref:GntR family transcriptional regulator n=1 Tax=Marinoscillum furvescens DSM 4134 TaxID=1122208 RepID=A0A3D9L438_MARFU|nr:winged helix-turn-helix domain-containing protein [Marinoscillum furvescens]RED98370.1 GntR family transcriptional regulator [Marinoscillum furvescens DSM 4134]